MTSFSGSLSVVGPSVSVVAVGRLAAVVRGVDVAVAVDVATIDVAVGVGTVGVDVAVAVAVANIASSGETVRSVGARLAVDAVAIVTVDGLTVVELAVERAVGLWLPWCITNIREPWSRAKSGSNRTCCSRSDGSEEL